MCFYRGRYFNCDIFESNQTCSDRRTWVQSFVGFLNKQFSDSKNWISIFSRECFETRWKLSTEKMVEWTQQVYMDKQNLS